MADQNKDESKPIASGLQPGPTEHLAVTSPQSINSTGAQTSGTTTSASSMGSSTAYSANSGTGSTTRNMAAKASETLKQNTSRIATEAKQYAGDMADVAKEKSRTVFDQQKETAIGKVGSFASALRTTAERLEQDQQQAQIGRYIGMAADRIESFGNQLRQKDLDTLIQDTQSLARRSPAAFFAGTVVAGFLLSRFLKSSSERMQESMTSSYDDQNAYSGTYSGADTGTYTTQTGTGAASSDIAGAYRTSSADTTLGTGSTLGSGTSSGLSGSSIGGNTNGTR